jgi:predicted amidohydrolase
MNNNTLQVAVIQMDVQIGQPEQNIERVKQKLVEAVSSETVAQKPDVIVLPEMWNTGYALTELAALADLHGQQTQQLMADFAREHQVNVIAGSVAVAEADGTFANRSFIFDRQGSCVAQYDKLHLFRLMEEEQYLQQGQTLGQFLIDDEIAAAIMICYDIRFPELTRRLALNGAKILFVPAQWPNPRLHHWRTLLQARAIENQMYVVACNRVGVSGETSFFGHSLVIDPWGEVLAEGDEDEAILRVALDLDVVDNVRQRIPIFFDRRPEIY